MNKQQLVGQIAKRIKLNQDEVTKVMTAAIEVITEALSKGDSVKFVGFGKFKLCKRVSRVGRNPRTGISVRIPERNAAKFIQGKELRQALNP